MHGINAADNKTDIKSMTKAELTDSFKALGLPKFRADQVYDWPSEW